MKPTVTLAIATAFLLLPFSIRAQTTDANSPSNVQQETAHMVAAQGTLVDNLDAQKNQPGQHVEVRLTQSARLDDGTKLPTGTLLVGDVVQDNQQNGGQSQLALRFTQAKLKDGNTLPIKATIVGVGDSNSNPAAAWSNDTQRIDQINAFSHVDLHSNTASDDSGVFVSTDNGDVKLKSGSMIGFALAH